MENTTNDYHISFFKPTTPQAVANRNMVVWLVLIWFIAIFGFQILLRVIEKPTPEPAYTEFNKVWENVKMGSTNENELQKFGQATLSVLGKVNITAEERIILDKALSWSLYNLTPDMDKTALSKQIVEFEQIEARIENISDPDYIAKKKTLTNNLSPVLGLPLSDIRSKIMPLELVSEDFGNISESTKLAIPGIMEKYLIHNQSILTDTKFLGFPFHYFYTAIFLLVLFVGLCLLYCRRTDRLNAEFNIVD